MGGGINGIGTGGGGTSLSDTGGTFLLFPRFYTSIEQGTWAFQVDANYLWGAAWNANATHADGDAFTMSVWLPKGTYTLYMMGCKATNRPIIKIRMDGNVIATFDQYNVASTFNDVFEQAGIVNATSSLKAIQYKFDGKNAASSNYYGPVGFLMFVKTA